jgi:nucleoside-triphosphatase THEP1
MCAWRFDRSPDAPLLAAVIYPNEAYPQATFRRVVEHCRSRTLKLSGVLQHPACEDPGHRCDVVLEDLASGARTELFERRGRGARGCRLDVAALADVTARLERALQNDPDLLVLNKFGKVEAEGGGLVDPIAAAIDRDIPVVIGVPVRNLEAWRAFAGDFAVEFAGDFAEILDWLDRVCCHRIAATPLLKAS